jgi:hypothetical protein
MTPEEHFAAADGALIEANSTNNTARFWAQMRVSEHHTALGRALSEHEARKADEKPDRNALGRALSAHEARRHAAGDPALIEVALRNDVAKLEQQVKDLRRHVLNKAKEIDRLSWAVQSRDASIAQLKGQVDDHSANEAAGYSPDQPTPLTDGLPAVPEGYCRMVIDAPIDTVFECADFNPIRMRLVDAEGGAVKVFYRRSFGRKTDYPEAAAKVETTLGPETVTVDFGGNGLGSKSRRIYGALRAAERVWRTPETARWRGLRGRWAVEASTPDAVEVFVRSVDYPDTDEVGVDLVTWPKDWAPGSVGHNRMEILTRQRMSRTAWATHPDNIGDTEHP